MASSGRRALWFLLLSLLLVQLLAVDTAHAASELRRTAFSSAGLDVAGGSFRLRGTVGEAGPVGAMSGGSYSLGAGFWGGVPVVTATAIPSPAAEELPAVNALIQNFPNPFRGSTTIAYDVAKPTPVRLVVYDVTGRRVATLADGSQVPGRYRLLWSGRDDAGRSVAVGVYFYRLQLGPWSETKRMLKLR